MSFVIYDVETTGLTKGFDQIVQFAALRTDDDLRIADQVRIRCRLMPHIIPSPEAMHVTGLGIDELTDPSFPSHYEMVTQIRRVLESWCPSLFLGFNSLSFDEEFLRQAFYQCLYGPYLTNTQGSARADERGFPPPQDDALMRRFHAASWEERPALAHQFQDDRYRRLSHRLIFFDRPELLGNDYRRGAADEIRKRLTTPLDAAVRWRSIAAAEHELQTLIDSGLDNEALARLRPYAAHLERCRAETQVHDTTRPETAWPRAAQAVAATRVSAPHEQNVCL